LDGTELTLREGAEMYVDEFVYERHPAPSASHHWTREETGRAAATISFND
jgi:hypothetical protein